MTDIKKETVVLSKDMFVLNVLAMGVAIQMLAKLTGESPEAWQAFVGYKATEQYKNLSSEQIQDITDPIKLINL